MLTLVPIEIRVDIHFNAGKHQLGPIANLDRRSVGSVVSDHSCLRFFRCAPEMVRKCEVVRSLGDSPVYRKTCALYLNLHFLACF